MMSFEKAEIKNPSLYPERPSADLDPLIEQLRKLERGEAPKIELDPQEKKELLEFENAFGKELEEVSRPVVLIPAFYVEYFLTPEGKEDFKKVVGIEIHGNGVEEIQKFLLLTRASVAELPAKERSALVGRTRKFSEEKMLELLLANTSRDGVVEIDKLTAPEKTNILLDPGKALKKLTALRDFRRKVRAEINRLSAEKTDSGSEKARLALLEIYRKKVTQALVSQFSSGIAVLRLSKVIGKESLSEAEQTLLDIISGLSAPEKNYSRYDKFIHGASREYDTNGMSPQITERLKKYADEIEKDYIANELEKDEKIKEKGLDSQKLFAETVSAEQFTLWEEELLNHYGEKSAAPASEYFSDREGPAPDNKWQFVARPEYRSMGIDGKQKVIKSGTEKKSVVETISVLLGHETEGHMLRTINKSRIPLKLFDELGGDRTDIFAEGGAMMVEDMISRQAFGVRKIPHPHYIRAMARRLEGGGYLDCVKTFFESAFKILRAKKESGLVTDTQLQKETEGIMLLALNRTKRLFDVGTSLTAHSPFLTDSGDTAYLEQRILLDKLRRVGLEKYAFVGGCNLNTLIALGEIGLLDLSKIQEPKFYSLKIWEKIKDAYRLQNG